MYFSNHDHPNKIGFAGSYGELIRDVEREAKDGENYLDIFTIFLDKIYGLEGNYLTLFFGY